MLSKRLLFAVLAVRGLVGCVANEELSAVCPNSCYTGASETRGVGVCKQGTPVCDEGGNVVECQGEVLPGREICDNLDNNCDGLVDEHVSISPQDPDNRCTQCGSCRGTVERCEKGNWYCDYAVPPAERDDTCDGVDEDCDCQKDEDVRENSEVVFCYTGPTHTATQGECRPGVKACVEGRMFCVGEVTPAPESCDEADNDCNGLVDDVPNAYEGTDIVFGIDMSGSMEPFYTIIAQAVCRYSQAVVSEEDQNVQLGLVLIAQPNNAYSLAQDLTDAATLCTALDAQSFGGVSEPSISTAKAVVDPVNPLNLSWRPSSKRVFVGFTDEFAQVDCTPVGCVLQDEVAESVDFCLQTSTSVYWFVKDDPEPFTTQARGCGGDLFWLSTYGSVLETNLNAILVDACHQRP